MFLEEYDCEYQSSSVTSFLVFNLQTTWTIDSHKWSEQYFTERSPDLPCLPIKS